MRLSVDLIVMGRSVRCERREGPQDWLMRVDIEGPREMVAPTVTHGVITLRQILAALG